MNLPATLIALFALASLLGVVGWQAYERGWDNGRNALVVEQAQDAADKARDAAAAATAMEPKKEAARRLGRDLNREVNRYAATDAARADCFDVDGGVLFNAILAGRATAPLPGGGSAAVLPGAGAAGGPQPRLGEPGGERVRRGGAELRAAPRGAGGLREGDHRG